MALCIAAASPAAATPSDAVDFAPLVNRIEALRQRHHVPAVVLTVVSPDQILYSGATGTADRLSRVPATPDQHFRVGSITKTFTALAVMRLVERRTLDLATPVRDLVAPPPYDNPWARQHPVTLAMLLEHTAGLDDLSAAEFAFNEPVSLARAFAVAPASRILRWPPGLHASYSNSGAGIVAHVIEQTTGEPFEAVVAREVFAPLHMPSATFFPTPQVHERLATGYDRDGETAIPYWHVLYRAFGAINTTPREMGNLIRFFLNRGRLDGVQILSEVSVRRMETPASSLAARSGLTYGYGLGVYQSSRRGVPFFGHGGDADGYLAHFAYAPSLQRGYFVVINAFNGDALARIRAAIETHLIDRTTPSEPAVFELTPAERARVCGDYLAVTRRFRGSSAAERLRIIDDDGDLYTVWPDGRRRRLVAVNAWHFRRPREPLATIALVEHAHRLYLQGDLGNYEKKRP